MAVYYAHNPDNYEEVWEYGDDVIPTFEALQAQVTADGFSVTLVDGLPPDQLAATARAQRDSLLQQDVDTLNGPRWAGMSSDKQAQWSQYRTDLLNVPQQSGFPNTISWPTKPE